MEYKLKYPLENLSVIKMRRPKVKDLLELQELQVSDSEKEVMLFERLSGVSKDVLRELDIYDYSRLQEMYADFLKG